MNKPIPVETTSNLVDRVIRLLKSRTSYTVDESQLSFGFENSDYHKREHLFSPNRDVTDFLDFSSSALPDGDVYLFGGILRDIALFGKRGFDSDIDLVVEGDLNTLVPYLISQGAKRNKFGGYRFNLGKWPIDIWSARETWAIAEKLVAYEGISSLLDTTVLNWDAILMNWRTKQVISRLGYFEDIKDRSLDIVLKENPNPLGMTIRVLRHLCLKDARKISKRAINYLSDSLKEYSFQEINKYEIKSYKNPVIDENIFKFFKLINTDSSKSLSDQFSIVERIMLGQRLH